MVHQPQIAVLGAGIQGSCIALELARRGQRVLLLDQDSRPLNRTSVRNEGKIHLGLVYANDPANRTAELLLDGALHFYPLLSRWLGTALADLKCSTPFYYLAARDSIMPLRKLESHYRTVEELYIRKINDRPELNYLGLKPHSLYHRISSDQVAKYFDPSDFLGGFETEERAIDTSVLAGFLRWAIAQNEHIEFLPEHRVQAVERTLNGFRIEGTSREGTWALETEQVINAAWANRMAIDQTLGIEPESDILHRLKYRVLAELPSSDERFPSVTMVIGRYGDVVIRPDNTVYLSWYPAALKGWSSDLQPPDEWDAPVTGRVPPDKAQEIAAEILNAIQAWYPGIKAAKPYQVDAGVIFAHGRTDVDDHDSGLHNRTQIGVKSYDGYLSVSTGKFTMAPLFAVQAAEAVTSGVCI